MDTDDILFPPEKEEGAAVRSSDRNPAIDVALGVVGGLSDAAQAIVDLPSDIASIVTGKEPEERQRFFPKIETQTGAGDFANTATQVVTALIGAGKFIKAAQVVGKTAKALTVGQKAVKAAQGAEAATTAVKETGTAAKIVGSLGKGALTDFMFFGADEERLMDTLVQIPGMDNALTRYFASSEDEGRIEARLKYALEGAFTGAAVEGLMFGLKAIKLKIKGSPDAAEKIAEAAEKIVDDVDPLDPKTVIRDTLKTATEVDKAGIAAARIAADTPDKTIALNAKAINDEIAKMPDVKVASYAEFLSSTASKRLKNTVEAVSSDLAEEVKSIMGKGNKDIADAFSFALATNKQYVKLATGIRNKKFLTLMAEAVRDKVVPSVRPTIKAQARKLLDNGFEGEALETALSLDASVMDGIAPRLALYRMEDNLMANRLALALKESLTKGTKEAQETVDETLADFITHAAQVQQIISNMGRGLASLKTAPNKIVNKKAFSLMLKEAEDGASGIVYTKKDVRDIISGAGKKNIDETVTGIRDKDILQAIKDGKPVKISPDAMKAIRAMIDSGFDPHNKAHAEAMLGMFYTDNNKLIRFFTGKRTAPFGFFKTYFVNNLLSSPATHVFNTVGNILKAFAVPTYRILGGMLEGDADTVKTGLYQFAAYRQAIGDSLQAARAALKRGEAVLDYTTHYPATTAKRIMEDMEMAYAEWKGIGALNTDQLAPHVRTGIQVLGHLGATGQIPLRVMGATDEFFKQMIYRSEVYARAAVKSADAGKFSKEFYEKAVKEAFDEQGRAADLDALQSAREATWTRRLDGDGWFDKVARAFKSIPGLGAFVPFITTPTNLLKDLIAHTPAARLMADYREAVKKGPEAVAVMKGKMAFGSAIIFSGIQLAANGRITGGYPSDPVAKQVWDDLGIMPYAFKIGDTYIPYNRVDPFGAFFGICADFYDTARRGAEDAGDIPLNILASVMKVITSKTYLTGLMDAINFAENPDGPVAGYVFGNLATGLVPLAGLLRYTARELDPEMKETQGIIDRFRAMIPIASESVPSRYSWLTGKPMEYHYFKSDFDEDMVLRELAVQADAVRGGKPQKTIGGYKLSPEEYSELCRIQGNITIGGKTLYEALSRLISSYAYQQSSDEVDHRGVSRKSKMVSKIMAQYQDKAAQMMVKQYGLGEAIKEHRRKQQVYQQEKRANVTYDLSRL